MRRSSVALFALFLSACGGDGKPKAGAAGTGFEVDSSALTKTASGLQYQDVVTGTGQTAAQVKAQVIEERRRRLDIHHLLEPSNFHLQVQFEVLADFEPDVLLTHALESRKLRGDEIAARGHKVEDVHASRIRHDLPGEAGRRRLEFDDDARKYADCALEGGVAGLS